MSDGMSSDDTLAYGFALGIVAIIVMLIGFGLSVGSEEVHPALFPILVACAGVMAVFGIIMSGLSFLDGKNTSRLVALGLNIGVGIIVLILIP